MPHNQDSISQSWTREEPPKKKEENCKNLAKATNRETHRSVHRDLWFLF